MTHNTQFLTPTGRMVQGDPFEPQTKDQAGAPLTIKTGPNAGQATQRYFIAVAFAKTDPSFAAFHQQIKDTGRVGFPAMFDATGNCTNPRFAFKVVDGDGFDENGKSNANKEGFAGHWVVKFNSSFPPRCFHQGHYQPHEVIQDKMAIRRGYFVRVAGTMEPNNNQQRPGVYINLNMVELVAQGPEIVSGPDASSVFGSAPVAALPAGAVRLSPVAAPAPAPTPVPVTPNPAFVAGPRTMTAKAGGHSYAILIAAGWTDEMLRAEGMMV